MWRQLVIFIVALIMSRPVLAERWKAYGNWDLPPMSYMDNNTPKGFGVEITKAVLEEAQIPYQLIAVPWKRAYQQSLNGDGLVFGLYWTQGRSALFDYTESLWEEEIVLVTKKGKEFPFHKIEDLTGKTIAMQRGTRPGTEFEKALRKGLFIAHPNNDPISRLLMLKKERVDAALFNPGAASVVWNTREAGLLVSEFTILEKPLAIQSKHIGIAKSLKREDLIKRLDLAIQKLKENGTIEAILNRYQAMFTNR